MAGDALFHGRRMTYSLWRPRAMATCSYRPCLLALGLPFTFAYFSLSVCSAGRVWTMVQGWKRRTWDGILRRCADRPTRTQDPSEHMYACLGTSICDNMYDNALSKINGQTSLPYRCGSALWVAGSALD